VLISQPNLLFNHFQQIYEVFMFGFFSNLVSQASNICGMLPNDFKPDWCAITPTLKEVYDAHIPEIMPFFTNLTANYGEAGRLAGGITFGLGALVCVGGLYYRHRYNTEPKFQQETDAMARKIAEDLAETWVEKEHAPELVGDIVAALTDIKEKFAGYSWSDAAALLKGAYEIYRGGNPLHAALHLLQGATSVINATAEQTPALKAADSKPCHFFASASANALHENNKRLTAFFKTLGRMLGEKDTDHLEAAMALINKQYNTPGVMRVVNGCAENPEFAKTIVELVKREGVNATNLADAIRAAADALAQDNSQRLAEEAAARAAVAKVSGKKKPAVAKIPAQTGTQLPELEADRMAVAKDLAIDAFNSAKARGLAA